MKNIILGVAIATGVCAAVEAAPTDAVTQADLQALIERITKLEAENKAQAARIAEPGHLQSRRGAHLDGAAGRAAGADGPSSSGRGAAERTGCCLHA